MPFIKEKEQRSFADRKARMMLMKRGQFEYAYNAQSCTEESHGIIMVADLTNEASDTVHLPQIVEEVRELRQELGLGGADEKETKISADSGYCSTENIKAEGDGIELLIASGREKEEKEAGHNRSYSLRQFRYDREEDAWRCPQGRQLRREAVLAGGRYRYGCADCADCQLRGHCLKPGEDRRMLVVEEDQLLLGEMRARLKKPENDAVYRKRKWVAEQPFGQIKEGMGFRGVTVRGDDYARGQWLLVCAMHNLMKAVRFITSSTKSVVTEATAGIA